MLLRFPDIFGKTYAENEIMFFTYCKDMATCFKGQHALIEYHLAKVFLELWDSQD